MKSKEFVPFRPQAVAEDVVSDELSLFDEPRMIVNLSANLTEFSVLAFRAEQQRKPAIATVRRRSTLRKLRAGQPAVASRRRPSFRAA